MIGWVGTTMETYEKGIHLNLFHRIFLFLIVFILFIFLRQGFPPIRVSTSWTRYRRRRECAKISAELLGQTHDVLSSYRWDFGVRRLGH